MGNRYGNFSSHDAAAADLVAGGFEAGTDGFFRKADRTTGSLIDAPRDCVALVEISFYTVAGKYAADGIPYKVFQHHFL